MIGSGAPAQMTISHLPRNQIIQKHVIVVRRVYLYGLQTNEVARSLNTTVHHIHDHSDHRPKPQTYPSVNMWKINNELTACLYTQVIVTQLPVYAHKHFLAIIHGPLQTRR